MTHPTARELHAENLYYLWTNRVLCDNCDDRGRIYSEDPNSSVSGWHTCEQCPQCPACKQPISSMPSAEWLIYIPEIDSFPAGYCSATCYSMSLNASPDPIQAAKTMQNDFDEYHWGSEGLDLNCAEFVAVACDREMRTWMALRDEYTARLRLAYERYRGMLMGEVSR